MYGCNIWNIEQWTRSMFQMGQKWFKHAINNGRENTARVWIQESMLRMIWAWFWKWHIQGQKFRVLQGAGLSGQFTWFDNDALKNAIKCAMDCRRIFEWHMERLNVEIGFKRKVHRLLEECIIVEARLYKRSAVGRLPVHLTYASEKGYMMFQPSRPEEWMVCKDRGICKPYAECNHKALKNAVEEQEARCLLHYFVEKEDNSVFGYVWRS